MTVTSRRPPEALVEFKRDAVRLAKERGNIEQIALELGISDNTLPIAAVS